MSKINHHEYFKAFLEKLALIQFLCIVNYTMSSAIKFWSK